MTGFFVMYREKIIGSYILTNKHLFKIRLIMITRKLFFVSALIVSNQSLAFPCFFTLAKDNCWINYDVTVLVIDVQSQQQILSVTIPKGKAWVREPFVCQPNQKLDYTATFSPIIWEGSEGVIYKAQHYWMLPAAPTAIQKAWEIPVCYPSAFSEVPYPPTASGHCKCDFTSIPAIDLVAN